MLESSYCYQFNKFILVQTPTVDGYVPSGHEAQRLFKRPYPEVQVKQLVSLVHVAQ